MRVKTHEDRAELNELLRGWAEAKKAIVDRESQLLDVMFELLLSGKEYRAKAPNTPATQGAELMTIEQAAEYLQCSQRTVSNYLKRGCIRGLKFGNEWRILRDELIEDGRKFRESKNRTCATFEPLQAAATRPTRSKSNDRL